jgi:hypothetical protein
VTTGPRSFRRVGVTSHPSGEKRSGRGLAWVGLFLDRQSRRFVATFAGAGSPPETFGPWGSWSVAKSWRERQRRPHPPWGGLGCSLQSGYCRWLAPGPYQNTQGFSAQSGCTSDRSAAVSALHVSKRVGVRIRTRLRSTVMIAPADNSSAWISRIRVHVGPCSRAAKPTSLTIP